MLRTPAYCGRAAFAKTMSTDDRVRVNRRGRLQGRTISRRRGFRERSREEWIEIKVPEIVPELVFERVARRLQDNKHFAARRTIVPSLLQGLLVCKSCGYSYYRTSSKTVRCTLRYYRCTGGDAYRYE